jgi:hypothetical protein
VSPRPYWRGYLKLSLVSCLIALHAACTFTLTWWDSTGQNIDGTRVLWSCWA